MQRFAGYDLEDTRRLQEERRSERRERLQRMHASPIVRKEEMYFALTGREYAIANLTKSIPIDVESEDISIIQDMVIAMSIQYAQSKTLMEHYQSAFLKIMDKHEEFDDFKKAAKTLAHAILLERLVVSILGDRS